MEIENTVKSTEEQAVAAWISYLNQLRLDKLFESLQHIGKVQSAKLASQAQNLSDALESLEKARVEINDLIDRNRGGEKGLRGYIAEPAQVGIGNARNQILGGRRIYTWINNNGQWDITRAIPDGGTETPIQIKFVNSNLSLDAILDHLKKYPDSLEVGGKYMIPKDQYEKIIKYLNTPPEAANKLPSSNGEFNLRQWKKVNEFFRNRKNLLDRIEPAEVSYREVQKGAIGKTLSKERKNIKGINEEQKEKINRDAEEKSEKAYLKSKPSVSEGIKATVSSSAVEGTTAFCVAVIKKRKSGKSSAILPKKIGRKSAENRLSVPLKAE